MEAPQIDWLEAERLCYAIIYYIKKDQKNKPYWYNLLRTLVKSVPKDYVLGILGPENYQMLRA